LREETLTSASIARSDSRSDHTPPGGHCAQRIGRTWDEENDPRVSGFNRRDIVIGDQRHR